MYALKFVRMFISPFGALNNMSQLDVVQRDILKIKQEFQVLTYIFSYNG